MIWLPRSLNTLTDPLEPSGTVANAARVWPAPSTFTVDVVGSALPVG